METNKRITWLDAAKGYGILLVIFAHVDYYSFLRGFIYTFHMPLFFFLSGYVFSQKDSFGKFLWAKVKRIIIPYFCLGIPMILFDVYWQNRNKFVRFPLDWVKGEFLSLLEQKRLWTLWYIACLFFLNLLFYALVRWIKNEKILAIVVGLITVAGLVYYRLGGQPFYWNIDTCMTALPFFYVGYLCRKKEILEKYVFPFSKKWILVIVSVVVTLICLLINLAVTENHLEMYYGQYGVEPITYLGAFAGILLIVLLSWKFVGKVIRYLGRNSMIYYAWHQTIVIPLVDEFYRKQGYFQQLKLSTMQFFCKNVISVVMICLVLTVVSILINHTFLRVAVGGPLRIKKKDGKHEESKK